MADSSFPLEDDNPWASAAAASDTSFVRSLSDDRQITVNQAGDDDQELSQRLVRALQRVSLGFDLLIGVALIVYGILLWQGHDDDNTRQAAAIVTLTIGAVLVLRMQLVLLTTTSRCLDDESVFYYCRGCSLRLSAVTSLFMAPFWLIAAILALAERQKVTRSLPSWRLSPSEIEFLSKHYFLVWSCLLTLGVIECLRYRLWKPSIARINDDSDGLVNTTLDSQTSSRHRPWWWRKSNNEMDNDMRQSLLQGSSGVGLPDWVSESRRQRYREQTGVTPSRWFGRWRRRDNEEEDARDEADSVDFASVQEEWASRTEEDPYWWSREEESTPIRSKNEQVSWLGDKNGDASAKEESDS